MDDNHYMRALVLGAHHSDSLGTKVADALVDHGHEVVGADINNEPGDDWFPYSKHVDVTNVGQVAKLFETDEPFDAVVYCVGINYEDSWSEVVKDHMNVNFFGAVNVFSSWIRSGVADLKTPTAFVTISSNSAHIARSTSAAYCASKAALSMWTRCTGRKADKNGNGLGVWGYEPGWLEGTPMSSQVADRLGSTPGHAIPGGMGINPKELAAMICHDLERHVGEYAFPMTGQMIRVDRGEQ